MKDFVKRIKHVKGRERQAIRNLYVRNAQKLLGIEPIAVTELNYLLPKYFKTKILSRKPFSEAQELSFNTPDGLFRHNFEQTEIVTISDAVIDTQFNHIYAITRSNNLMFLRESSDWPATQISQKFRVTTDYIEPKLSDVTLGLSSHGYFHMFNEDLPRLCILGKNHVVLQFSRCHNRILEIASQLAPKLMQVPRYISVQNLTFISHGSDLGYLNSWQRDVLTKSFANISSSKAFERIYISRSQTRRSPTFELELQTKLSKLGFKILHLENFNFSEQYHLLSQAKVIIAIHGAGLSGTIWAETPLVIELMNETYFNRCFEWQTLMGGGNYKRIEYSPNLKNPNSIYQDIVKILDEI